jgi:hypothetical protein
MGTHLIDGQFQSDKYPTTPRGKVPLSVKDTTAQDLLWVYAQRRRSVDAEFSADLETALIGAGFFPPSMTDEKNGPRDFRKELKFSKDFNFAHEMADEIDRLRKLCEAYKVQVESGAAEIARLRRDFELQLELHRGQSRRLRSQIDNLRCQDSHYSHWDRSMQRIYDRLSALEQNSHPPLGQDDIYERPEKLEREIFKGIHPSPDDRSGIIIYISPPEAAEQLAGCTILFEECDRGHGRLRAKHWTKNEFQGCIIDRLRGDIGKLRMALSSILEDHRGGSMEHPKYAYARKVIEETK